jgi:DNA-binding NtrC family response regulator
VTLGETLGSTGDETGAADRDSAAELILALECDRPAALSTRHRLVGNDEVRIGRGRARLIERGGDALAISVPDARMSAQHARVERSFGRWVFVDLGSKNGSLINGEPALRRELVDGDVIEIGRTLFLFRAAVERDRESPADVDLEGVDPGDGTLTLDADLEREIDKLGRLAGSEVPLLLLGESGTGKEVLARAFHRRSGRGGEMVAVNCGAIPETLIESELFGHRKGAFSGAVSDSIGLVRAAEGGTLFLDEIADLPVASQAVLLRVLQEREVRPVGGTRSIAVDIRLVAATHQDLPAMVAARTFRDDLYARISGFRIEVPPLRQRRADLGLLIGALLSRLGAELGRQIPRIDIDAARQLFSHDWPLNIRELETTLRAALVLATDHCIEPEHLPVDLRPGTETEAPRRPLEAAELSHRDELIALLEEHRGNLSAVSRAVGKDRKQIHRWLKRYGLDPDGFRS